MRVEALHHVQIALPPGQEEAARRFYAGLLGIPETAKPPHLAKRGGCWFEHGNLRVHLGVEADFRPARKAHPAFTVADLGGLIRRLASAGIEIIRDEPLAGYHRC
ncbi:VOC family protein [Sphingomonas mucosissima]|uniref:Glyoxalase-like domain protein n=1 Tax=Sphingomonas mucosissima TaxID=370959 RepID=A0A245ZFI5_9SPHN|nr:VOC family protein [Sphingomonas mucosissima]OWK28505.1 glyoxalase-like domain protein [Sphingomonas mucosissima]